MKAKTAKPIRPNKNLADLRKLLKAYRDFLDQFEIFFYCDDNDLLDLKSAIDNPELFDGDNNATRDSLLRSYSYLKRLLGEKQIQPSLLREHNDTPTIINTDNIEDLDI